MRALQLDQSEMLTRPDWPEPKAGPGDAVVRVTTALLSDPAVRLGGAFSGVAGFEATGVVETLGPRYDGPAVGERIAIDPWIACRACDMCRRGAPSMCRSPAILGVTRDGVLAERVTVPARNLVPIPTKLPEETAPFAWLASRADTARRAAGGAGPFVTVIGDGALALFIAQALHAENQSARLLTSTDRSAEIADRLHLKRRDLSEVGLRRDQDVVILTDERGDRIEQAVEMVRPRGRLILTRDAITPSASDDAGHVKMSVLDAIAAREIVATGATEAPVALGLGLLERGVVQANAAVLTERSLDGLDADLFARLGETGGRVVVRAV